MDRSVNSSYARRRKWKGGVICATSRIGKRRYGRKGRSSFPSTGSKATALVRVAAGHLRSSMAGPRRTAQLHITWSIFQRKDGVFCAERRIIVLASGVGFPHSWFRDGTERDFVEIVALNCGAIFATVMGELSPHVGVAQNTVFRERLRPQRVTRPVGVEKVVVRWSSWGLQMAGEQRYHPSLQLCVGGRW